MGEVAWYGVFFGCDLMNLDDISDEALVQCWRGMFPYAPTFEDATMDAIHRGYRPTRRNHILTKLGPSGRLFVVLIPSRTGYRPWMVRYAVRQLRSFVRC